jgi:hypothetical protein
MGGLRQVEAAARPSPRQRRWPRSTRRRCAERHARPAPQASRRRDAGIPAAVRVRFRLGPSGARSRSRSPYAAQGRRCVQRVPGDSSTLQCGSGCNSAERIINSTQPSDPDRPLCTAAMLRLQHSERRPSIRAPASPDPDRPTAAPHPPIAPATRPNDSKPKKKKNDEDEGYVRRGQRHRSGIGRIVSRQIAKALRRARAAQPAWACRPTCIRWLRSPTRSTGPSIVWDYSWANPDDEAKMKAAMEDLARTALGLNPPPAPAKPAAQNGCHLQATRSLRYAASARSAGRRAVPRLRAGLRLGGHHGAFRAHRWRRRQEKFVTLIAQPDLYGNVAVLVKNVTDAAHLDDTPRMRLVDAVDAWPTIAASCSSSCAARPSASSPSIACCAARPPASSSATPTIVRPDANWQCRSEST